MPPETAETTQAMSRGIPAASSPGPRVGASPGDVSISGDWAAHLTQKVEDLVAIVRDKTVRPVATAVRYLIFGLVALTVGTLIAVLFAVFTLRVLDTEVPVFRTRVWASYLIVAGIFWAAGLLLTRKRHPRK